MSDQDISMYPEHTLFRAYQQGATLVAPAPKVTASAWPVLWCASCTGAVAPVALRRRAAGPVVRLLGSAHDLESACLREGKPRREQQSTAERPQGILRMFPLVRVPETLHQDMAPYRAVPRSGR